VTPKIALIYVFSALATALAWALSRRRPQHRPVATLLTFGLASDLAQRALKAYVLTPGYAALGKAPATGWLLVARHADQALFLAWPAGLAALTMWVYLKRRPWPIALGYAAAVLGIVILGYPAIRGPDLHKPYLAVELACVAVATGAFLHWIAFRKDPPTATHWMTILMVGTEVAGIIAGPWRLGLFSSWNVAQFGYLLLYATLVAVQGVVLWMISSSTTPPSSPPSSSG
jgi:hypothetical protein